MTLLLQQNELRNFASCWNQDHSLN